MTILELAGRCCGRLQIPIPTTLVGNTETDPALLREVILDTITWLINNFAWPELQKEYTFPLVAGTSAYAIPADIDRIQSETLWNRTEQNPLIGPFSASEWQEYQSGLISPFPYQQYRIKGWGTNQFFITPAPDSGVNGHTMVYEYISRTAIRPKAWVASTSWSGMRYCSYDGNIYDRGSTGAASTGTNPPVHTGGSANDGSISWTYVASAYSAFAHDNDEVILNNEMVIQGAEWRFRMRKNLEYLALQELAESQVDGYITKFTPAETLKVNRSRVGPPMVGPWCYPRQNFG